VAAFLSHLFLHVSSLARTWAFYVDGLGLELLAGSGEDGSGYMRIGGGDGFTIGVEERPAYEIGATGVEIVVRVDDVDVTYNRLRAAGVRFEAPPADQEWGMRQAWLRDPDGYRVTISSPIAGGR
jgi:catechol 2,3-dioxygenase-like lactoylglutathione lyase family enzyme